MRSLPFDLEQFLEDCRAAVAAPEPERAVRELVTEAVAEPRRLLSALSEPKHAGIEALHRAADLTVIDFTWAPWMSLKPHNHNMWSVIGILAGREDNIFWRRIDASVEPRIEAAGARSLGAGDVAPLGPDIIHSVTNPLGRMTRAIHVYGGDFFAPMRPRSEWNHETLLERPWDLEETRRLFAEADARARPR